MTSDLNLTIGIKLNQATNLQPPAAINSHDIQILYESKGLGPTPLIDIRWPYVIII